MMALQSTLHYTVISVIFKLLFEERSDAKALSSAN